jgi:hypothetical protein
MQLFRRLCAEHGYQGGYDQVRRSLGRRRRDRREPFLPLAHDPGHRLECDFGHIHVDFPEGRRLVPGHIFEMNGESFRFRESMKTKKGKKPSAGAGGRKQRDGGFFEAWLGCPTAGKKKGPQPPTWAGPP